MSINLGNLELTLIQKIDSATSPIDVQTYTKALEKLRNGNIYTVSTFANLPPSNASIGKIYYVDDENSVVFASDLTWITLGSENNFGFGFGQGLYCSLTATYNEIASSLVQEVSYSSNWCCIHAGDLNSYGLKKDGTLWAWGYNAQGRRPSTSNNETPTRDFTNSTNWCSIAALNTGGSALKSDGTLWSWGQNGQGESGTNTSTSCSLPIQENTSSTNWSILSPKGHAAFSNSAIKTDGTLWAWGFNLHAQLGDGTDVYRSSPVQEISSSTNWCFATLSCWNGSGIKTDGTLWVWGWDTNGQLGLGVSTGAVQYSSPVQETTSSANWCYVSLGDRNTRAIKTDGTLWGIGLNSTGQLATGNAFDHSSPVQEITSSTNWCLSSSVGGASHALKTDGSLWMWGCGCKGLLLRPETTNYSSPIQDPCSLSWVDIHGLGIWHTQGVISVPYL